MARREAVPHHRAVPPRAGSHPYLTALGKRIRTLREERGWTQEDLEERSSVVRVYISRIEGGRQNPSVLKLRALARALKVTITDLLPPEREP
jgi:transcriptional regulator with XRE-family HTH domain